MKYLFYNPRQCDQWKLIKRSEKVEGEVTLTQPGGVGGTNESWVCLLTGMSDMATNWAKLASYLTNLGFHQIKCFHDNVTPISPLQLYLNLIKSQICPDFPSNLVAKCQNLCPDLPRVVYQVLVLHEATHTPYFHTYIMLGQQDRRDQASVSGQPRAERTEQQAVRGKEDVNDLEYQTLAVCSVLRLELSS